MAEESIITLVSKNYADTSFQSKLTKENEGDNITITGEGDSLKINAVVPGSTSIESSDDSIAVTPTETGYDLKVNDDKFIGRGEYTELEGKVSKNTTDIGDLGSDINTVQENIGELNGKVANIENEVNTLDRGKQDTLTAGANIKIENNVISATGGGSATPESINELFDTYATWEYARLMSRMTLYYDGNICRTLPKASQYTIDWEINECADFPKNGFFIPMEIMVPKIVTTEDNVYVGLVPRNAKIGDMFKSLSIITHKPLETAGVHFNVPFVYFNCNDESVGKYAGPNVGWTGWLNSMQEGTYQAAQLVKKTVDGEEVYEYTGKISPQSSLLPLRSDGLDLQKTTGPTGSPVIIGIDGFHMILRGRMYPNVPVQMSYRYAYAPYENIIGESTTFISEYDARAIILNDWQGDRNKIATKEYVKKLAIDKLLDMPWDQDYVPYQPDLPTE